ncbi:MAG TPA: biotin--[acetyl-CoA-carboxylase] ligase [Ktedonobacteraceae bacterium]|nr:biotin--[acetyl-CoA-carboxylase] ligase [Ktedonobacteraceae bacterium]
MDSLLRDALDVDALSRSLETQYFGRSNRLLYLPTVESTNTLAMQLARERPDEGLVVLTDNQTAGKGRQGRRWVDVPGCNVLLSIVLRPSFPPHLLVMIASLAVVDAIARVCHDQAQAVIKWPNDVLIEERKVAGILIETSHDAQGQMLAVIGIGINVNGYIEEVTHYLAEQAPFVARATTLETVCGHPVKREVLIASLLRSLEEAYLALQQETSGVLSTTTAQTLPSRLLREKWRDRLATLGRAVTVRQGNSTISGIAEDVDGNGELLLRNHSGELICITWGSVDHPTG